ncbi:MAG: hypothetical protein R3B09_26825 [Nannocystaceae bacterium]
MEPQERRGDRLRTGLQRAGRDHQLPDPAGARRVVGVLKPGAFGLGVVLIAACVPDVDVDLALVTSPRVLAVAADPAEVGPGEKMTLRALYAAPGGTLTDSPLVWSRCSARRPLAELGPVSRDCIDGGDGALTEIGDGLEVASQLPPDVCRLFGPDPPPGDPGGPAGRPVDPDLSGGYYQPIVLAGRSVADSPTLFRLRIACGLAAATQEQSSQFRRRYQRNLAPAISALERVSDASADLLPPGEALVVEAGERVRLRARWTACPGEPECGDGLCTLGEDGTACAADCGPPGCAGAEYYLRFDPDELDLVVARESLAISWFADAGHFDAERTGRTADDRTNASDNTWTAPEDRDEATLWIVIRDDRGGAAWRELSVLLSR